MVRRRMMPQFRCKPCPGSGGELKHATECERCGAHTNVAVDISSEMSVPEYDLIVIGSGPAGQKGAIAAAKAHKRVAVIDRTTMIGGVCVHTGTIPSKTVREAIFQLTGFAVKALYGN